MRLWRNSTALFKQFRDTMRQLGLTVAMGSSANICSKTHHFSRIKSISTSLFFKVRSMPMHLILGLESYFFVFHFKNEKKITFAKVKMASSANCCSETLSEQHKKDDNPIILGPNLWRLCMKRFIPLSTMMINTSSCKT